MSLVSLRVRSIAYSRSEKRRTDRKFVVDFVINLFACEKRFDGPVLEDILEGLEWVSLVFSCLFMAELLASIWAFGWG
jgi:hypothetical protein